MTNDGIGNYTFMAIVVGRYDGLFTRRSDISRGRSPSEIRLLRVSKASYLTTTRAYIVYYTEITHTTTKHFF